MIEEQVEIDTKDGKMITWVFRPESSAALPAVLFYMDAGGIRPSMLEMAGHLAKDGYIVLLPDLYYRLGKLKPFDFKTVFSDPAERDRIMATVRTLDATKVNSDTAALIRYLGSRDDVRGTRYGTTGYCMGGRYAFTAAAAYPESIAAAGSFHASQMVTDRPDSPHLLANKIRATLYIAPAGTDHQQNPEESRLLSAALKEAKVNHTLEVYEGAGHGYAVPDAPTYNAAMAERHWQGLKGLFNSALPQA